MQKCDILKCVNEISKILKIEAPKIEVNPELFKGKTLLACSDVYKNTIIIRQEYESDFDLIFSLAHECRHFWQFKNGKLEKRLADRPESSDGIKLYNLREEEIDANAFATAIMRQHFGAVPLFNGFDDDVKQRIFEAEKKIAL